MKLHISIAWALVLVPACHAHDHQREGHIHAAGDDRPALSFTHWTDTTELFMECPAFVRGEDSACAAHVTRLQPFSALASGRVDIVLRATSREERFGAEAPTVPGIFRPVAKPASAGSKRLWVEIRGEGIAAAHDLGEVTVYENTAAARAGIPEQSEPPGRITFLKEQQWPIDFATEAVSEHELRPSMRAFGNLRARTDADVTMSAPVAGRISTRGETFPQIGQRVTIDDPLGALAPRLEAVDLASLQLAIKSGTLEVQFAERERQRLENLRMQGAVPERRVQEAKHTADEAQATLSAAERRLEQFRRVERPVGSAESAVVLRAPLTGTITAVHAAPGAFVEAGAPLFRVTDLTQLWLEVHAPAADLSRLDDPQGASFSIDHGVSVIELAAESLAARARVIDPSSQTLSLLFHVDNASGRLPAGAYARVQLVTGDARRTLALPESALVDDSGVFVVFVQMEGEAFERRPVRLGVRDRGLVEVMSGLRAAERVVTLGAWSVKLAASSGAIPAHGHAH